MPGSIPRPCSAFLSEKGEEKGDTYLRYMSPARGNIFRLHSVYP
jgi:hypothetical protein